MKKIKMMMSISLVMILMLTLMACGSNGSTNTNTDSNTNAANQETNQEANNEQVNDSEETAYPTKEVKLIVPAAAGGTLDLAPRAMSQAFQEITGQPLVVENHPGGGQVPGAMLMVDADPDGYTLAMLPSGLLSLRPALQEVDFNFPEDFTAIVGVGDFQIIYAAPADAPYDTMAEMVEYYKTNGGEPRMGSAGVNTFGHILAVMVAKETGMNLRHLPFDGNPGAVTAILGGNAEVAVVNLSNVASQLEAGTVKILGVPAKERYSNYEQASTLIEQGIDVVGGATFAVYGPGGMSSELQQQLHDIFTEAIKSEQFNKFVENTNLLITNQSPDQVVEAITNDFKSIEEIKEDLQK